MGSVPDNHSKVSSAVTVGHRVVCFSVLIKVMCKSSGQYGTGTKTEI